MRVVPAKSGWTWTRSGLALFRRNPALWLALVCSYWMLMLLANLAVSVVPVAGPWLGLLVSSILIPPFSVSFMVACRTLDERKPANLALLFSGFHANLPALAIQGGVYLACVLATLAAASLADDGLLARWMLFGQAPAREALTGRTGSLVLALAIATLIYTPVLMAFWFAPTLAAWRGMGALQSLFYSFFATLRNWRPFLVYSLAFGLLGGVLPMAVIVLAALVLPANESSRAALQFLLFPVILVLVPSLFASFYASYRDIFPDPATRPTGEAAPR
jgi:hypothetical protein